VKTSDIKWKEQIREAALCFLADRAAHAFPVEQITARIRTDVVIDHEFDESHVADALAVLEGYGLVKRVNRPLSGLVDFQATSEGVTFRERQYP
jgi:hypothetical protein